jgi:hypothetical protein
MVEGIRASTTLLKLLNSTVEGKTTRHKKMDQHLHKSFSSD